MPRILAVGGAHIDHKGWLDAPHRPGASNPGHWRSEPGGGAFNAARNLARLGHQVTLVAPRGGDALAGLVADAAREAGIEDCPLTFLDRATPSYTAILEPDGNLVTALADMALYDLVPARRLMTARFRARLEAADLLLADANLPGDALAALTKAAHQRAIPVAAIAVSPAKVVRWKASLPRLTLLAMNMAEAVALTAPGPGEADSDVPAKAMTRAPLQALMQLGLTGGLVSDGGGSVQAFQVGAQLTLAPPPLAQLTDVTGAGDALASGFIDGLLNGGSLEENLARGIALARLTLEVAGPVRRDLSGDLLAQTRSAMPMPTLG